MLSNLLDEEKFTRLPFGPLEKYISKELDMILDVSHIKNSFVVYSSCVKNGLWNTAEDTILLLQNV